MEQVGIDNLKIAVKFGLALGSTVVKASSEATALKKAAAMLEILDDVPALFTIDYQKAIDEAKNLSADELSEIGEFVQDEFDIDNDELEAKIEESIKVALEFAAVLQRAAGLWAK
jgi:hypothetical protein